MNIDIANRLYELRKEKHYSQEELAEKIGVSRQAVSKWERAEASPDTDNLILLSQLYGISLDELLHTEEKVETANSKDEPEALPENESFAQKMQDHSEEDSEDSYWSRFPYPLLITILYLILGFGLDLWHPAWILFVTIPVYYSIVGKKRYRRRR